MKILQYTCTVKCWDGVIRSFDREIYATNTDILRHRIAEWNGCNGPYGEPYQYYETPQQAFANDVVATLPPKWIKNGTIMWFGKQSHDYSIKRKEDK